MIKTLAVILLVASLTVQQCDKGCLKCNAKNECVFCDTTSNYFLSSGKCSLSTLTNCLVLAQNGDCARCAVNFYLDTSTKKCVAVDTAKATPNCLYYSSLQACVACAKSYFIKDSKCSLVTKTVDNCESYSDDGKCEKCASGYLFNATRDGCIVSPNVAGCSAYSFLDCKSCSAGYIANQNLYFNSWQISPAPIVEAILKSIAGSNDWTPVTRCQKLQDPNCLVASSFNSCVTCAPGYFLTSAKTCRAYPKPIIQFCLTYNNLVSCTGCLVGYYLESSTKCSPITGDKLIVDCATYDNTVSNIVCTSCNPSKFLSANLCTNSRVNSLALANCKTVSVNADNCQTCNDGFILRVDNLRCIPVVPNCAEHNPTTTDSTTSTCNKCKNGFYFVTDTNAVTTCVAGGIPGCLVYNSKDVCTVCDTSAFYLASNSCAAHQKVENCSVYSGSSQGECSTCATGFYPFKITDTCEKVTTVIPNCLTYNKDDSKCTSCGTGFFLKNDNTCVSYSTLPGCKLATIAGICSECLEGYAKKTDNTCELNHDYITKNCAKLTPNAIFKLRYEVEDSQCEVCKENTYPLDLNQDFVCMKSSAYDIRYPVFSSAAENCLHYSFLSGGDPFALFCLECKPGYYLKLDDSSSGAYQLATCALGPVDQNEYSCVDHNYFSYQNNMCLKHPADATGVSTVNGFSMKHCARATAGSSNRLTSCLKLSPGVPATTKLVIESANALHTIYYPEEFEGSSVLKVTDDFWYNGYRTIVSVSGTDKHNTAPFGDDVGQVSSDQLGCELYTRIVADFVCFRCKWGYSVRYTAADASRCVKVACNLGVKYGGFLSKLNQILSCHACSDSTKVLTAYFVATETAGVLSITGHKNGHTAIQCLTPLTGATDVHSITQPKKIDNCLIYGSIFAADADPDITTSGCLSCAPGYAPATLTHQITSSCVKIEGCDENQSLYSNRCYACTQKTTSGVDEFKGFGDDNLQTCKKTNTANCLFTTSTVVSGDVFKCGLCKPRYVLNKDSQCELVTLPQCSDTSLTFAGVAAVNFSSLLRYNILYKLNQKKGIRGCSTCNSGYSLFRVRAGEKQCAGSSYVTGNKYITDTKYVPDCARYKREGRDAETIYARCSLCKNSKVVTLDGLKCVTPKDSKCLIAKDVADGTCHECLDSHVAINGSCINKSITDCATYDTSSTVSELICTACKSGFVYNTTKKTCTPGNVFGCSVYPSNQPWQCTTCRDGFAVINTPNNRNYCIKINDGSNCSVLDSNTISGLQSKNYRCTSCTSNNSAGYIPKAWPMSDVTKFQSICLALNPVENCVEYDAASQTVGNNSFLCTKCKSGFYLDDSKNACVARLNLPTACTEYEVKTDKCKVCGSGTFLSADAKDCVSFPNGIFGCATYTNDTVCASCEPPRYLANNTCQLSTVINNCAAYSANNTCTNCASGFFLTNATLCEQAKASNCFTYTSINACASCDPKNTNVGLKNDNGIVNCVDKNVANCEISTNEFPFKCTKCRKDFYLGVDGNCQSVSPIERCLAYDSMNTCLLCEKGAVLSVDRKSCNATYFQTSIDLNCDDTQQLSTPVCSMCAPGQIFANGTCSSCLNNTAASGCFSCNPNNQSECFACKPGFYQTINGTCISMAPQANNTVVSSALTIRFLGLISIVLALLF